MQGIGKSYLWRNIFEDVRVIFIKSGVEEIQESILDLPNPNTKRKEKQNFFWSDVYIGEGKPIWNVRWTLIAD